LLLLLMLLLLLLLLLLLVLFVFVVVVPVPPCVGYPMRRPLTFCRSYFGLQILHESSGAEGRPPVGAG
jgi:hypothetical protein